MLDPMKMMMLFADPSAGAGIVKELLENPETYETVVNMATAAIKRVGICEMIVKFDDGNQDGPFSPSTHMRTPESIAAWFVATVAAEL